MTDLNYLNSPELIDKEIELSNFLDEEITNATLQIINTEETINNSGNKQLVVTYKVIRPLNHADKYIKGFYDKVAFILRRLILACGLYTEQEHTNQLGKAVMIKHSAKDLNFKDLIGRKIIANCVLRNERYINVDNEREYKDEFTG